MMGRWAKFGNVGGISAHKAVTHAKLVSHVCPCKKKIVRSHVYFEVGCF